MPDWLPEALAAVHGRSRPPYPALCLAQFAETLSAGTELLFVALADDRPVGLMVLTSHPSEVWIDLLTIAGPSRNLGLGAEAVFAAEARHPNCRICAGIPPENGLAIYFWLRAGYRPLYPSMARHDLPKGRIWMVRDALKP